TQFARGSDHVGRELTGAVDLCCTWGDDLVGKGAKALLKQPVLRTQREVHVSPPCRSRRCVRRSLPVAVGRSWVGPSGLCLPSIVPVHRGLDAITLPGQR